MTVLQAAARVALGALAGAVDGALAAMHPTEAVERAESYAELLAEAEAAEEDTPLGVRPTPGWLNDFFDATAKFVADTTPLTEAEALDFIENGVDPKCGHQSCAEAAMGLCLGVHGAQTDLLYAHRAAVGLSMPPHHEAFSAAGDAAEAGPASVEPTPGVPGAGHPEPASVVSKSPSARGPGAGDAGQPQGCGHQQSVHPGLHCTLQHGHAGPHLGGGPDGQVYATWIEGTDDSGHYPALLRRAASYASAEAWALRDDRRAARRAGDDYYALRDLAAQFEADELTPE